MTEDKLQPIHRIAEIKRLYRAGEISEEDAREMAKQPLEAYNDAARRIAKEFDARPHLLTFEKAMRIRNFYF